MMYKYLIRPLLFQFDAEKAHHIAFWLLGVADNFGLRDCIGDSSFQKAPRLDANLWG